MTPREQELTLELERYKNLAKEAMETDGKTVVHVYKSDGGEIKVFSDTPQREQAFAETLARWWKLLHVTSSHIRVKEIRNRVAQVRDWADRFDHECVDMTYVVDQLDAVLEDREITDEVVPLRVEKLDGDVIITKKEPEAKQ